MALSIEQINKLEQENAELKAENERLKVSEKDLSRICQGFKKQIEEEKSLCKKYYQQTLGDEIIMNELHQENEWLKAEIKEYKKRSKCAWKCFEGTLCEEGEKYKQTLQEIKQIAEQSNVDCIYRISVIRKILTKAESEG